MPGFALLSPWMKRNAIAAVTLAATANGATLKLPIGDVYELVLDVTAATGTSPTLDCVVQTSFDGGTNWIDLPLRYAQKTAAASEYLVFKLGLGGNEVALGQAAADTGGSLAKNCVFDPQFLRIRATVGGTNPSFTYAVHAAVLYGQRVAG